MLVTGNQVLDIFEKIRLFDSKLFAGTREGAIGLCLDTSIVLVFLGTGTTLVTSHAVGKVKDDKYKLKMYFKGPSCLLYTSPSPRDRTRARMPSSA